jgi:hypothetical protein
MMTYAPAPLLDLRVFMRPLTGLPDNLLGITPDPSHDGGYHCGWDDRRIVNGELHDYAWQESSRDWNHKTNAARAFDVGMFPLLRELSVWMVGECARGAPDTLDMREIIYSPDGVNVLRWDRLGKRSTGDNSHLTHTHFDWFADAENRDKISPFRRFFEENFVATINQEDWDNLRWRNYSTDVAGSNTALGGPAIGQELWLPKFLKALDAKVNKLLMLPPGSVDPEAIRIVVREELDKTKLGPAVGPSVGRDA